MKQRRLGKHLPFRHITLVLALLGAACSSSTRVIEQEQESERSCGGFGGLHCWGGDSSTADAGSSASSDASSDASSADGSGVTPDNQSPNTEKLDLLLVIDNSASMGDKQRILAEALPVLVERLVNPVCVNPEGQLMPAPAAEDGACPAGFSREFQPLRDIHLGVITTSLGDFGDSQQSCTPHDGLARYAETNDGAHQLGGLPRGAAAIAAATDRAVDAEAVDAEAVDAEGSPLGFLRWGAGSQAASFGDAARSLVLAAGERGCGYESTLEAWYRFLIDPWPYQRLVRKPCSQGGTPDLCVGPEEDGTGAPVPDIDLLVERAQFLRPDSILAIVMLSDENDCSFKATGQSWRLTELLTSAGDQVMQPRATAACEISPDDPCCASCGQTTPTLGCSLDPECYPDGDTSNPSNYLLYTADEDGTTEDAPALRCFKQKRRFGINYLYPVQRYINALTQKTICPGRSDLTVTDNCFELNPLFYDPSAAELDVEQPTRDPKRVILTGILGVPWQDLAVDPSAASLVYRTASSGAAASSTKGVNWSWLLGSDPQSIEPVPGDPFLHEQVEPRPEGASNPALPEVAITLDPQVNPINGHEWNVTRKNDLQYACTFALPEPRDCNALPENEGKDPESDAWTFCNCDTAHGLGVGGQAEQNPTCQAPSGGAYGSTQYAGKAYPGIRQLQVLHGIQDRAVVTSICPKTLEGSAQDSDFGYNPMVAALVERLKPQLAAD